MNKITSNQFTQGLNTDIHPKFQADGSYRFALNAVLETREGDHGTISNELGNTICAELPYGTRIIGHANTETEEILLFLFHRSVSNPPHQIGIYNPINCTYTPIAISSLFNFSDQHQINAFIRVRNGCERVVYFTDNYNPYRVANITDTSDWITPGTTNVPDITKIKFSREYIHPSMALSTIATDSGGVLPIGTFNFVARYIDAEGNPTNWMEISRPIAVSDDSTKLLTNISTYCQYDGGSNLIGDVGFVVRTNKAIGVQYSNLDTRFTYLQVGVVKCISTDGSVSGVDILVKQPIVGTTMDVIYSGVDSQIETQTSIDEILSEYVVVDKVKTHAHLDSRLYIGNTTNTSIDYKGFQRHASRLKVEYVKVRSSTMTRRAKQPNYYFGDASFLADEVYALGIVYVFKDGSISPVFHIPGRRADDNIVGDHPHITSFTKWDTDNIPADANVYNPAKTKRWQVYNTSTKYVTPTAGHDVEGLMGYYETATTYPVIDNPCETNPEGFWGVDHYGELIVPGVTKIRHHRMPSHEQQSSSVSTDMYKTGVKFTMTLEYPHADIVGHYYVHSDRTYEKTIVDKGILIPAKKDENPGVNIIYAGFLFNRRGSNDVLSNVRPPALGDLSTYLFISPKTTLEDSYSVGAYLRVERYLTNVIDRVTALSPTSERTKKILSARHVHSGITTTYTTDAKFNYKIDWNSFLTKSIVDNNPDGINSTNGASSINIPAEGKPIANLSIHNNWLVIVPDSDIPFSPEVGGAPDQFSAQFSQVSLKSDLDVFANLSQIIYRRIDNAIHKKVSTVQLKTYTYSGDIFVSNFALVDYAYARNGSGDVFFTGDALLTPIESELAYEFRHGSDKYNGEYSYYKFNPNDPEPLIPFVEYVADKYYEPVPGETSYFYPETYLLNKSFNRLDSINRYYPLTQDYEFCNDCLEDFPHRIYYSELDNAEDSKDYFRMIKPLNYQDLSGSTGEINDLFINFNKLIALTDLTPYEIQIRPQQLISDDNNIYIGTAEVFGIPPNQLKVTDYHFGGSRLFKSRTTTEYGSVYIDDFNGRPILMNQQITDLSLKGMRNFWQEHGTLYFEKQFYQVAGVKYDNYSTSSDTGIGYISTFDPRFKRLIIHKKDYKYISNLPLIYQATKPTTKCVWYDGRYFYYISGGSPSLQILVSMEDPAYFENKSFTISYSFLTQSWVSFHSYQPYYLFNNYIGYFSNTFDDDYIYKHLEGNHTEYYSKYSPHIIDLVAVSNPNMEMQYTNLMYATSAQELDDVTQHYRNVPATFNEAIFYNTKQSSGIRPLKLKTDYFEFDYDPLTVLVDKTDNKYKISNIRDIVVNEDEPIWDSSWTALQSIPFEYIDKVPNAANLNINMPEFDKPRFRDYYLGVRLIYNPTANVKLNTDIINTLNANRNR